jgi:hypothetical protein
MPELANIKPAETILVIVHPRTLEMIGIKVPLLSLDDETLKAVKKKIQNQASVLSRRGKSFDADQIEANHNLICFTAMTGWDWSGVEVVDEPERREGETIIPAKTHLEPTLFHGEKPAFNQTMVYKVFDELPWFRDQISEKIGDTASFFQT